MKKYTKPTSEKISLEMTYNIMDMSLQVYDRDPRTIDNIDDYFITDGSQILVPQQHKNRLWEVEE